MMFFSSWLRKWKRSATVGRQPTSASRRQRAGFRPRVEALEDRWLPSSGGLHGHGGGGGGGSGGGGGGLPYATAANVSQLISDMNYANQAGGAITIDLAPSTTFDLRKADNTTNGGNGLPVIGGTKAVDLTILGNGDTIERVGSKVFRLLDVAQGASLTLDNVTLQGGLVGAPGAGGAGGAIYNQGTLNVSNSTLSGNSAVDGGSTLYGYLASAGGAIFNNGGTVTISNGILSGNSAYEGGGIDNDGGTLTISNSTLSGNSASFYGGAIFNYGTLTVNNSTLSGNSARDGGGIFNDGGTLTVEYSDIYGNTASDDGGGIYNYTGAVTVVEQYSSISGNTAYNRGADVYNVGELDWDSTGTIGILDGSPAILI